MLGSKGPALHGHPELQAAAPLQQGPHAALLTQKTMASSGPTELFGGAEGGEALTLATTFLDADHLHGVGHHEASTIAMGALQAEAAVGHPPLPRSPESGRDPPHTHT